MLPLVSSKRAYENAQCEITYMLFHHRTVPGKEYHCVVEKAHVGAAGNQQASLFWLCQEVRPAVTLLVGQRWDGAIVVLLSH